jgi:formate dehydrogenase (NAD+, ferredoxin) subunit C
MAKEILTVERFEKLQTVIEAHKGVKGPLMPVLIEGQKIFGCLPLEVQKKISEELRIPLSEIYGVVTFYSAFSLEPKGDTIVTVCMGTACYVKGAQDIIDKLSDIIGTKANTTTEDKKFSLLGVRCVGACGLAPIIIVNEVVYGKVKLDEVPEIMKKYKE